MDSVALCGFMGCGKSTTGALLARQIKRPFVDLDTAVEEAAQMKIAQIFEQSGEAFFRALESRCLRELSAKKGIVLALGGGAVLSDENKELLRRHFFVIFLDVPFAILQARAGNDPARPLSGDGFYERYAARLPLYRAVADVIITGELTPAETVQRIHRSGAHCAP